MTEKILLAELFSQVGAGSMAELGHEIKSMINYEGANHS
jgi:hypothetical protein